MMEKPVILLLREINLNSLDALESFFHNKDSGFIHRDDNDIVDNPIDTVGIAYDKKTLSLTSIMKFLKPQAHSINGIMLDGEQWMSVNELNDHRPSITEIIMPA